MSTIRNFCLTSGVVVAVACSTAPIGSGGGTKADGQNGDVALALDGGGGSGGDAAGGETGGAGGADLGDGGGGGLPDGSGGSDGGLGDDGLGDDGLGDDGPGDAGTGDGAPSSDSGKDGGGPTSDTGTTATDADVAIWDSFFDPDIAVADTGGGGADVISGGGLAFVFAHSSDTLYRMDVNGFLKIGYFSFNMNPGSMTDIAMDKNGTLYGVTFSDLFKCDSKTAKCTWLAALPESFNGLTFVPKGTAKPNDEALIGIANSGAWNLIEVTGTSAKVTKLGSYGGYSSSGDAFSVETIGTFATVKDANSFGGTDILVQVDPKTGAVIKKIGNTGVSDLWGFAWFNGKFYGFSDDTNVYEINTTTAKATTTKAFKVPSGVQWWGAAVSTRAALD